MGAGNYGSKYDGEVTLMDALARSINTVAIRLAQIDGVSRVVEMARRMGISTPQGHCHEEPFSLCWGRERTP